MPAGGSTAASSLYSGIFNKKDDKDETASSSLGAKVEDGSEMQGKGRGSDIDKVSLQTENESASSAKPQAWSAALRFAPRKNTSQNSKMRKPLASAMVSATFSATPIAMEPEEAVQEHLHGKVLTSRETLTPDAQLLSSSGWSKLSQDAGQSQRQVQIDALRVSKADQSTSYSLPIVTAPPELNIPAEEIENDKALFAELAMQRGEGKVAQTEDQSWYEDEDDIDDVNGFGNTEAGRKARRKKNKRKRNVSPGRPGASAASLKMDADYDVRIPNDYSQFKDLVRKRREAVRRVEQARKAQKELEKYGNSSEEDGEDDSDEEDNDEKYRRSKMSRFAPPSMYSATAAIVVPEEKEEDDEKPYLSPPPSVQPALAPTSHSAPAIEETGEEAYLRRLAMSQMHAEPSKTAVIETKTALPPQAAIPDFAARAAAAAAIAAKLAKAGPPQSQENVIKAVNVKPTFVTAGASSTSSSQDASFAQKLMERQGWKQGEALGAEGNKGLVDPILAKKVEAARVKQKDYHERQATSNRGTLVNAHDDEKRREEREKFGAPSEVILLENMVNVEDIDDELSGEIGEECAKHGYVQRVFIWPQGPSGVRIFVKFSGMAGAWRCVKELEGRYFGGKTVRARYYPLIEFERGNYMNT